MKITTKKPKEGCQKFCYMLKRIAANIVRTKDSTPKRSVRRKLRRAAYHNEYFFIPIDLKHPKSPPFLRNQITPGGSSCQNQSASHKIPWKSIDASCVQRTKFNSISSPNLQNTPLPLTNFMQNPWVNKPLTLLPPDFQDPLQGWARIWDSQKTVKIHPRVLLHSSEGARPDGPQSPAFNLLKSLNKVREWLCQQDNCVQFRRKGAIDPRK